ncbi:unnamed protein product [Urochloa decumbens]|uniref:Malvidin galactosylase UGT88C3 n=1 Tax=Urochloa decumbens TaxID=240449 RepID=A0ABC9B595_9POAL
MANPTFVLRPIWGTGHLMPMLQACRRLLCQSSSNLSLTVLIMRPPTSEAEAEVADLVHREKEADIHGMIHFHNLPTIEYPSNLLEMDDYISELVQLYVPHVRAAIATLAAPVAGVVIDFFCTAVLDICHDLAIPSYVYFAANASTFALLLHLESDKEMEGMVDVPGLPPVPRSSLPLPLQDKTSMSYKWFVYHSRRYMEANGIIINTAAELEPAVLAAIADHAPTIYPIGPVLSLKPPAEEPHECVRWLDSQPPASVVLLCFGSMGSFSAPQVSEMARGLERSGQRFLWVLRGPPAAGEVHPTEANLEELLPEGFLERTKRKGLVWPRMAPQKEILAHPAVGGFVTHCGWNSVLESLWFGVPMAPWPLYAEQHFNAFTLVSDLGVAVAMKMDRERDNWVDSRELERAVNCLMGSSDVGMKVRKKAIAMKDACRKALEKGGSSYSAVQSLYARAAGHQIETQVIVEEAGQI